MEFEEKISNKLELIFCYNNNERLILKKGEKANHPRRRRVRFLGDSRQLDHKEKVSASGPAADHPFRQGERRDEVLSGIQETGRKERNDHQSRLENRRNIGIAGRSRPLLLQPLPIPSEIPSEFLDYQASSQIIGHLHQKVLEIPLDGGQHPDLSC